jgi:hypothetical protein
LGRYFINFDKKSNNSTFFFKDAKYGFKQKVHEYVSHAKSDIDLRIESLKIEIDYLRSELCDELERLLLQIS